MAQFVLPDLGEGLEDAQLVQWLVREGETVDLNQPLCQVETAKAMVDIPSPYAGTIQTLHARPGDTVPVGAPLVTIAESGASSGPDTAPATHGAPTSGDGKGPNLVGYGTEGPAQSYTRRRRHAGGQAATVAAHSSAAAMPSAAANGAARQRTPGMASVTTAAPSAEPRATPLVRKIAHERGIDLRAIAGTGPQGRIRLADVERLAGPHGAGAPAKPRTLAPDEERISTVGLRKAIAARMVKSATTIPQFTEYGLFDASALVALRERLKGDPAYAGIHLTYTPFFIRALIRGIAAYPIMNSRWDDEDNSIIVKHRLHVGLATDTPRGLLVPVIHDAQEKSLADLARRSADLIERARAGSLDAASLSGSTITLTNVGAAGPVETGAPLINPPEVCIVGLGAIKPRPTVVGDRVEVRPGAWISMSCDHRVVDGATAAQFLAAVATALERADELV